MTANISTESCRNSLVKFLLLSIIYLFSNASFAVSESDFQVKDTTSLLNLCTVKKDDPLFKEAINFCHGYLVGAYHFYRVTHSDPDSNKMVCLPHPPPSRNEVFSQFTQWVEAHPEHMNEVPVESEFRFLMETWPCQ